MTSSGEKLSLFKLSLFHIWCLFLSKFILCICRFSSILRNLVSSQACIFYFTACDDQVVNKQRKTHFGIELPTIKRMTFGAGFHPVS